MLIEIHMLQNHSPANLNRDDLGAPKTCYFGGVMRSRISSQCIKRSIRMSEHFKQLCGGIRTRQLARLIAGQFPERKREEAHKQATKLLEQCGIASKDENRSKMAVYTSKAAIARLAEVLQQKGDDEKLAKDFASVISAEVAVPDMALAGRMLETKGLEDTTVEAALQVAHAISTHEARPEVDYYVAADDVPGADAGASYVDEAMFASACFYKYFSIHWEMLVENLSGREPGAKADKAAMARWRDETRPRAERLAAHTVGAFLRGAALVNPTGKQNSFAAHNPPDGILVEIKNGTPISYANAFAAAVPCKGPRDLVAQSVAQLGQYVHDMDVGYGKPAKRFWFSPNQRFALVARDDEQEIALADCKDRLKTLETLIGRVVSELGFQLAEVEQITAMAEAAP